MPHRADPGRLLRGTGYKSPVQNSHLNGLSTRKAQSASTFPDRVIDSIIKPRRTDFLVAVCAESVERNVLIIRQHKFTIVNQESIIRKHRDR